MPIIRLSEENIKNYLLDESRVIKNGKVDPPFRVAVY
jgi:hypothetical protein